MANLALKSLTAAGLFMLGGCATDGYYGGVGVGYGSGGYYGPAGYYDGYGGGYGGWYNDYYYPGAGYYVFDRGGKRHRWNDGQRAYWEQRRAQNPKRGDGQVQNKPIQNGQGRGDPRRDGHISRQDRKSVREFGATVEQRRAQDAADNAAANARSGYVPQQSRGGGDGSNWGGNRGRRQR